MFGFIPITTFFLNLELLLMVFKNQGITHPQPRIGSKKSVCCLLEIYHNDHKQQTMIFFGGYHRLTMWWFKTKVFDGEAPKVISSSGKGLGVHPRKFEGLGQVLGYVKQQRTFFHHGKMVGLAIKTSVT